MSRREKLLERMRRNPRGDWSIRDVQVLCEALGIRCAAPKRGGHFKVSHANTEVILTIPARRPIRAVYIKQLVAFVACVCGARVEK
jgi:hypothetical protein